VKMKLPPGTIVLELSVIETVGVDRPEVLVPVKTFSPEGSIAAQNDDEEHDT
jgi:hypothetical protein